MSSKMKIRYRVKYPCYHYNTGNADNGNYIAIRDFDNMDDAFDYRNNVNYKHELYQEEYPNKFNPAKLSQLRKDWESGLNFIDIEDGYIDGKAEIVRFVEEFELELDEGLKVHIAEDDYGIIGLFHGDIKDVEENLSKRTDYNRKITTKKLIIL